MGEDEKSGEIEKLRDGSECGDEFFLWFGDFCVDFSPLPLRSSVMAVPLLPLAILEILVGNLL